MKVRVGSHTCAHTCLKRDGTLQPQACMMPSSRRMCSRTCRYCSRLCSRRAITAESLRRDATPLLASLRTATGGGGRERQSEALAAWPASSRRMKRLREGRKESAAVLDVQLSSTVAGAKQQAAVHKHGEVLQKYSVFVAANSKKISSWFVCNCAKNPTCVAQDDI